MTNLYSVLKNDELMINQNTIIIINCLQIKKKEGLALKKIKMIRAIHRKEILIKVGFLLGIIIAVIVFACAIKYLKNNEKDSEIEFIQSLYNLILESTMPSARLRSSKEDVTAEVITLRDVVVIDKKDESEQVDFEEKEEPFLATFSNVRTLKTMEDLLKNLYTIEKNAYVTYNDLDVERLIEVDFGVNFESQEPKVLIFHTHSQEAFIDSRKGFVEDTIVGIGQKLADILANDYGIAVVHDMGQYDVVDGKESRGNSYERMEVAIEKILEKYPSIEVLLDLHRDGVDPSIHLVTEINGKPTARIMYFNGITRLNEAGEAVEMPNLQNPYLEESLAFTLQMKLATNEMYPDFAKKIYIKPYRYSLHMTPKSLLLEIGANTNTVEEAQNAMYPLAEILMKVLKK